MEAAFSLLRSLSPLMLHRPWLLLLETKSDFSMSRTAKKKKKQKEKKKEHASKKLLRLPPRCFPHETVGSSKCVQFFHLLFIKSNGFCLVFLFCFVFFLTFMQQSGKERKYTDTWREKKHRVLWICRHHK